MPTTRRAGLAATVLLAVVVLIGVTTGLLAFDPQTRAYEALRAGGLAAGSVVAMYALWLNDRRRRVDEQRHELEQRKADLDRERVADERFARAVELLGHEHDQVRVGAMHALSGLARSTPSYTQTVLDILCAYLRRPFAHPRYQGLDPVQQQETWDLETRNLAERQLQVRLTAQRLIVDLLPVVGDENPEHFDLDLTGAVLEYFDPSHRHIGRLLLRYATLHSSTNFSGCEFHGPAWFTRSSTGTGRLVGRFRCADAVFHERAWFSGVDFLELATFERTSFRGRSRFEGSTFHGPAVFDKARFDGPADFRNVTFADAADLRSVSWHAEVRHDGVVANSGRAVLPAGWDAASGLAAEQG